MVDVDDGKRNDETEVVQEGGRGRFQMSTMGSDGRRFCQSPDAKVDGRGRQEKMVVLVLLMMLCIFYFAAAAAAMEGAADGIERRARQMTAVDGRERLQRAMGEGTTASDGKAGRQRPMEEVDDRQ